MSPQSFSLRARIKHLGVQRRSSACVFRVRIMLSVILTGEAELFSSLLERSKNQIQSPGQITIPSRWNRSPLRVFVTQQKTKMRCLTIRTKKGGARIKMGVGRAASEKPSIRERMIHQLSQNTRERVPHTLPARGMARTAPRRCRPAGTWPWRLPRLSVLGHRGSCVRSTHTR